jgi:hypothetical protein
MNLKNILIDERFILFLIIIFPLLFIWQGLDFTDIGFFITNYQQVFNEPESTSYGYVNWLTYLIGGIWVFLFGDSLGLLGVNFAGVLIVYMTVTISYFVFKPYFERKYLLIGLLFAIIFTKFFYLIDYNSLTSLFFVASALFLTNGLRNNKYWQILFSGLVLGLSIFIRFPNILGFSLILGIFFYGYLNKTETKILISQTAIFVLGYILAIIFSIVIIKLFGHYDLYINDLKAILGITNKSGDHHNLTRLFTYYYKDYIRLIWLIVIFIIVNYAISKALARFDNKYIYIGIGLILAFISSFIAIVFPGHLYYYRTHLAFVFVTGIFYIILLAYITNMEKSTNHFRLVCFSALIILIITPLGSNLGLLKVVYGMWLPMPIAFVYVLKLKEININIRTITDSSSNQSSFILDSRATQVSKKLAITFFIILALVFAFLSTNEDSGNRFEMRYSINHPRLKGIFTTKERAIIIQELLDELQLWVKEDDYLLTYEEMAMPYFLTKTKPYLYCPQPYLYNEYVFRQKLETAIKERPYLPVVVRGKSDVWNPRWPKFSIFYTASDRKKGKMGILEEFIQKNQYYIAWENDFFEILVNPDKKQIK